jgi:hypothetical protein
MSDTSTRKHDELLSLLSQFCDNTLDAGGSTRLNAILRESEETQQVYADYMYQHAVLDTSPDSTLSLVPDFLPEQILDAQHPSPTPKKSNVLLIGSVLVATAAAALLMLIYRPAVPPVPSNAAIVYDSFDAQWSETTMASGQHIAQGERVGIAAGMLGITTRNRVDVVIEGPASFTFETNDLLILHKGQLTAKVPPEAVGFTVQTAHTQVVDLGTEFGVSTRSDETEIHVFAGRVETRPSDQQMEKAILKTGEAMRVFSTGTSPTAFAPETFATQRNPVRIDTRNTGVGFVGNGDPNWDVRDPVTEAWRQAVVRLPEGQPDFHYLPSSSQSKWIGYSDDQLPDNRIYSFRTAFALENLDPATFQAQIKLAVDDRIEAIRLNGSIIWVPDAQQQSAPEPWSGNFIEIKLEVAAQDGLNTLQFDVKNYDRQAPGRDASFMALRVEMNATANQHSLWSR